MAKSSRRAVASINMVPLIDVMLVLLIIFMITAPMVNSGNIDLPSVGQSLTPSTAPIEVDVNQDGSLAVRDRAQSSDAQKVSADDLISYIRQKQAAADQAVVIAADRNVRYEAVIKVMDLLQSNGVKRVGLLAKGKAD